MLAVTEIDIDDGVVGEPIGDLIGARARALGLSQTQLARRLDVSDRTVRAWIRGENAPRDSMIEALGRALGGRVLPVGDGTYRFLPGSGDEVATVQIGEGGAEGAVYLRVNAERWRKMSDTQRQLAIARAEAAIFEVQVEAEHRDQLPGDPASA